MNYNIFIHLLLRMALLFEVVPASNDNHSISTTLTAASKRKIAPTRSDFGTTTPCSSSQHLYQFELMTDDRPEESSWELVDVNVDKIVLSANPGTYTSPSTFYNETYCIEIASCHQVTVYDSSNDGICCYYGKGVYKIIYEEEVLMEGSDFGTRDTSILFGGSCHSQSPSISSYPSTSSAPSSLPSFSLLPSNSPSISPSLSPTISYIPTLSSNPSWSPTISNMPTLSPTELVDLIALDKYNRRYFPRRVEPNMRPEGSFSHQPIPNCTSSIGRVGCVAIPTSHTYSVPHWAGKIYAKPPFCDKRKGFCELGTPMSRKQYSLSELSTSSINPFNQEDSLPTNLPGGALATYSIVAADVNNDGMLDIIIGNSNGHLNRFLMNKGGGNFSDPIFLRGSWKKTLAIATADVNNDGMVDIIFNFNSKITNI